MQTFIRILVLPGVLLAFAASATAAVSVSTDKATYLSGETVQITITNTGPLDSDFVSSPFVSIFHLDTADCVYGCVGLPVVTPFPAGTAEVVFHDTGSLPDPVGTYRVYASVLGPSAQADYVLTGEVDTVAVSWGAIKALYREGRALAAPGRP